jgi:hypothetical protein
MGDQINMISQYNNLFFILISFKSSCTLDHFQGVGKSKGYHKKKIKKKIKKEKGEVVEIKSCDLPEACLSKKLPPIFSGTTSNQSKGRL